MKKKYEMLEKKCRVCQKIKKTPYKDICRNCYQTEWQKTIQSKKCLTCKKQFNLAGNICHTCQSNTRNEESRKTSCSSCNRKGLIIYNKSEVLCIKCNRHKNEENNPLLKKKRQDYLRMYSRKKRGSDLSMPIRKKKGYWKTSKGYIMIYRPKHANANKNGCINQHVFIISEHLKRPLKKNENVHHINGIRDDNRLENLELWHRGQCPGQRLNEKIEWCKIFLEEYGYKVLI